MNNSEFNIAIEPVVSSSILTLTVIVKPELTVTQKHSKCDKKTLLSSMNTSFIIDSLPVQSYHFVHFGTFYVAVFTSALK